MSVGRLRFKGDKKARKAKDREGDGPPGAAPTRKSKRPDEDESVEGWVPAERLEDLGGPIYLVHYRSSGSGLAERLCLAVDEDDSIVLKRAIPLPDGSDEPDDVSKVFVAMSMSPGTVLLKSSRGRYLTPVLERSRSGDADTFSGVAADADAAGSLQEWRPLFMDNPTTVDGDDAGAGAGAAGSGGVSRFSDRVLVLRGGDSAARCLAVDSRALRARLAPSPLVLQASDDEPAGAGDLRAALDDVLFRPYVQAPRRAALRRRARLIAEGVLTEAMSEADLQSSLGAAGATGAGAGLLQFEQDSLRKSQSRGAVLGPSFTSAAEQRQSSRELRKAQKAGRLAEALLDRRSKAKSDRFCM
ncbi:hypothetical protein H696_03322 [Fonticula alba]|uniref:Uncharacterized protein n=1 Tax=Fonticula alba TaxID=691883 RepID=A0A058Z6D3_FONAL|nr:hypothetical protein H696_03322 [Fonticula alba]KCV69849.1 hypothetical protein H696_03322 [Fonticula alba]|eukprot:XP_009495455.1 hypothetical protein H696_03322 [Fonticula alba]